MLVKNVKCALGKNHHIRGGPRGGPSTGRRKMLGESEGMLPQEILKSTPPKTGISCIQLSKENSTFKYCTFGATLNRAVWSVF